MPLALVRELRNQFILGFGDHMLMRNKVCVAMTAVTLFTAGGAFATITPSITTAAGTIYNTGALTGFVTTGADMDGSVVTVSFLDGTTNSVAWAAVGVDSGRGAAVGTGWSLTEAGDTFTGVWTLTNSGSATITGFTFDGVGGNTTFDFVNGPEDSPGSGNGRPLSWVHGPAGLTVQVLYTNELEVGGTFYGDTYTQMQVALGGSGLAASGIMTFATDTDSASTSGPDGGITLAPEPASIAVFAAGLGCFGLMKRRRHHPSM